MIGANVLLRWAVAGTLLISASSVAAAVEVEGSNLPRPEMLRAAGCSDGFVQAFLDGREQSKDAYRDSPGCMQAYLRVKRERATAGTHHSPAGPTHDAGRIRPVGSLDRQGLAELGCSPEFLSALDAGRANQILAMRSGIGCLRAYMTLLSSLPDDPPDDPAGDFSPGSANGDPWDLPRPRPARAGQSNDPGGRAERGSRAGGNQDSLVERRGASGDIASVFLFLRSDEVLSASGFRERPQMFRPSVEASLKRAGQDPGCISAETWSAIRAEEVWVWVAFADCRLAQGRYPDAVENLDVAARFTEGNAHPLGVLILSRLVAVVRAAEGAGIGRETLVSHVGSRPTSGWLSEALRQALEARPESPEDLLAKSARSDPKAEITTSGLSAADLCVNRLGKEPGTGSANTPFRFDPNAPRCPPGRPPDTPSAMSVPPPESDPPLDHGTGSSDRLANLPYYRALTLGGVLDPLPAFSATEAASFPLQGVFGYWDAAALGDRPPALVGAGERWLVDSLLRVPGERLVATANVLPIELQMASVAPDHPTPMRQFVVRHAIARRALELGCTELARQQLRLIEGSGLTQPAIPRELGELHARALAASAGRDSGACPWPSR